MKAAEYTLTIKNLLEARALDSTGRWQAAYRQMAEHAPEDLRRGVTMAGQLARVHLDESDQKAFTDDVRALYRHQATPGRVSLPALPPPAAGDSVAKQR